MSLQTGITLNACPIGRAGINCFWVTDCTNVLDWVVDYSQDDNGCVTGVIMDAAQPLPVFHLFKFEKDTAFLNQEKTRVGNNINITQTLSFVLPVLDKVKQSVLRDLNTCCCLYIIVQDNNGRCWISGLSINPITQEWKNEGFQTGDGSANTGADPTADNSQFIETITGTTSWYAPLWDAPKGSIPV